MTRFLSTAVPWSVAILAIILLLRNNRETKNPLEWSRVDRSILLIMLFSFVGGGSNLILGIGETFFPDRIFWLNRDFVQPYDQMNRILGLIWISLLFIGLWLRKRSSESSAFASVMLQFLAIHVSIVCYTFGPVTHPGPISLSMVTGILVFLLFKTRIALPWLITFSVLTVASTVATGLGFLPYSPCYKVSAFKNGTIETYYLVGTMFFIFVVFFLMLILIAYIFTRWRDREKKVAAMSDLLKKMFGRYLSTEVMNTLIENPDALELGGERRRVTIMMTDLRGFTALSERLQPEQVVQLLNSYFEVMVEEILKFDGTINEIIGDALLVIFGAPQEMPDRAERGIACAISMQNAMARVNDENRIHGFPELEMGIGLNEADVIVGNIGSSKRSKYTVVGSGVNMASRIESYTVGGQILISDSIRKQTGNILRIDSQREVLPKGSETPIKIYEVGGIAGRFNLVLEERDPDLVTLSKQIPFKYTVLEGKHVMKKGMQGFMTKLSKKCAEVTLNEPVDLLNNIKMNLGEVDQELMGKDFYCKVIATSEENAEIHTVRFTAVPAEVRSYFQAHLQYAR